MTAGPFYIVWQNPERSGVVPEQWPYAVAELEGVESPAHRWPQLRLDASVPADAPARRGQEVFATFCLACHRLDGGGAATMGPDLGRPMSPTQYLTEPGLRALIRDPKSVRTWPEQHMPGFDEATLPEADLDAVIAYLRAKATK
jgi:mono/diheme cytochrome c family protein